MAPAAIPKSKAESVYDEFVDRFRSFDPIDDFTVSRFWRDAEAQSKNDPFFANLVLGGLAAYRFDIPAAHKYHRAAVARRSSCFSHRNYAISLQLLGLVDEALEEAIVASDLEPENLTALQMAMNMAQAAGALKTMRRLANEYEKRGNNSAEHISYIDNIEKILAKRNLSEALYRRSIKIANGVLTENKVHPRGAYYEFDLDSLSLLHGIRIVANADEVMSLQDKLAIRVADGLGSDWHPEALMFEYRPAK